MMNDAIVFSLLCVSPVLLGCGALLVDTLIKRLRK